MIQKCNVKLQICNSKRSIAQLTSIICKNSLIRQQRGDGIVTIDVHFRLMRRSIKRHHENDLRISRDVFTQAFTWLFFDIRSRHYHSAGSSKIFRIVSVNPSQLCFTECARGFRQTASFGPYRFPASAGTTWGNPTCPLRSPGLRASVSGTAQAFAFATGLPHDIYAFHCYTVNSATLSNALVT